MSSNKKHTLPTKELLDNTYSLFDGFTTKLVELNSMYLGQLRSMLQTNIEYAQSLYEVSTPEEFARKVNTILTKSGSFITKAFLDDLNLTLKMYSELCHCTVCSTDEAQKVALKLYDFYSKLLPSPLSYKFDDLVKSAVVGNQESIHALKKIVEDTNTNIGSVAQNSAKRVLSTLDQLHNNTKK